MRLIPAISRFGQKSNGQSSFLGGLVQYAAIYVSIFCVRLRQVTMYWVTVELMNTS